MSPYFLWPRGIPLTSVAKTLADSHRTATNPLLRQFDGTQQQQCHVNEGRYVARACLRTFFQIYTKHFKLAGTDRLGIEEREEDVPE